MAGSVDADADADADIAGGPPPDSVILVLRYLVAGKRGVRSGQVRASEVATRIRFDSLVVGRSREQTPRVFCWMCSIYQL